jgi:signal transduction histidine kinase/HPt (histidine-containing phosphotransfer) domain-containing protein/ActR/RegA family two-component response regulator
MKNSSAFVFAVCESFQREAESIAGAAGFEDVSVQVRPATCGRRRLGWDAIVGGCPAEQPFAKLLLTGGFCVRHMAGCNPDPSRIEICDTNQCLYLLAGKTYVDHCQSRGLYVMSPGWLEQWERHQRDWGFDRATARDFFGESMDGLLLLDSGLYPNAGGRLEALGEFVRLPVSSVPVGMDLFRRWASELVLGWRLKSANAGRRAARAEVQRVSAHSAMVLDLMNQLTDVRSEAEVIRQGLDLFTMLFAPESAVYDCQAEAGDSPNAAWSPTGSGFRIRIRRGEEDFGVIRVEGVAFPKSKDRYLAAALTLGAVMALAIGNARSYQALEVERDRAESATRAKSEFLSSMSHEIRTPMNGVLGMIQLLLTTDLSAEQQQYAEVVQTSGHALLALIDDILDLSKIEARKLTLEAVDFDVRSLMSGVISMLALRANSKGLTLRSQIAPGIPSLLRGDPARLRQILINLIANAIKFTDRGEIAVRLTLDDETEASSTVHFAVTDTGIGIPRDRLSAVFSPFVQADASTTRKYGGTGLGLAISQQLAELMGGSIGAESEEGAGSTFWFTAVLGRPASASDHQPHPIGERPIPCLPPAGHGLLSTRIRKYGDVSKDRSLTVAALIGAPTVREGLLQNTRPYLRNDVLRRQPRILVAEDDPTNQAVARALLGKLGFMADTVGTGAEAVHALEAREYDLILMDCQMPIMDGYEATRRIRASGKGDIPIIALSADAMQGHRERCIREGMNDFLPKPVELRQLSEMILKWLRLAGGEDTIQGASLPAGEAAPTFDEGDFLGRLMNDRGLARAILGSFVEDCPLQLAVLSERLSEADAPGIRQQAHQIKGAAASVSAESLRALALAVERAAIAEDLDCVGALLPRTTEEFERFKATLQMAGWLGQLLNP